MCAVNRDCKIPPVRKYNAALSPDTVSYVGIAEDEPKRLARLDGITKVSLLAKSGMTEADAYKLCQEHGLLSPIYAHCRRNGCWFCPNEMCIRDSFMGSGTTGMVASQMGRHFVGVELNPEYTELAYKRIGGEI